LTSTVPVTITSTWSPELSVAVAPGSVKTEPTSIVIGSEPSNSITGAVGSTTLTVRVILEVLSELSVAV